MHTKACTSSRETNKKTNAFYVLSFRAAVFSPCRVVVAVARERVFEVLVLAVLQSPLQGRLEALVVRLEGRAAGALVRRKILRGWMVVERQLREGERRAV